MKRGGAAAALLVLVALPGCGKKGDPLPPLRPTPAVIKDLRLAQRGDRLQITFSAPKTSADGGRLPVLEIELLVAQGDGDFQKLAKVRRFKAAPGEAFTESEPLPAPDTYVRAGVRALARGHRGSLGEAARLVVVAPLAAPTALEASVSQGGVDLAWEGEIPAPLKKPASETPASKDPAPPVDPARKDAASTREPPTAASPSGLGESVLPPREGPPGQDPPPAKEGGTAKEAPPFAPGFFVYRRGRDGVFGAPLQATAAPETRFSDPARPGESWCYVVRAVASAEPLVESAPSNEACVDVTDIAPPEAPLGLTVLAGDEGVELSWSASAEADLKVYRVYRTSRRQKELLAEVVPPETSYVDATLPAGVFARYTVTAVDQAGNESAAAIPADARRP